MSALGLKIQIPDLHLYPYSYGWTGLTSATFPIIGGMVRRRLTTRLQALHREIIKSLGPECEIDAVGHSMGVTLLHESMTRQSSQPKCFYRRLVYMGGIVSSRETFKDEAGHFQKLLNIHSRGDDVVRLSPFGQCGYRGFTRVDPKLVLNLDLTPDNHRSYAAPGVAWTVIAQFLEA
jgi:hypothetical protein